MTTKIFVNLPVRDLQKSIAFCGALGFAHNAYFTDETASAIVISEDIHLMLVAESLFRTFTNRQVTDTTASAEVIVSLSADSREQVDALADKAAAAGGTVLGEAIEDGFMYMRGFLDLDGHQWGVLYMDPAGLPPE